MTQDDLALCCTSFGTDANQGKTNASDVGPGFLPTYKTPLTCPVGQVETRST